MEKIPTPLMCGYKWEAPFMSGQYSIPKTGTSTVTQKCVLSKDHEGPHRSLSNVIKETGGNNG